MSSAQIIAQNKSRSLFSNNLVIAITIHLLLICLITVHFNEFTVKKTINISFLGAILDPFETNKIKTQNHFSAQNTLHTPLENQQRNTNTATLLTKPHFNQNLTQSHKSIFKSAPEKDKPLGKISENNPNKPNENLFLPQPYQRLKLYP